MGRQPLYYWFEGGMRALNRNGASPVFHVESGFYRADFDVFRSTFTGFDIYGAQDRQIKAGLHSLQASLRLSMQVHIDTGRGTFICGEEADPATQAYVMDNGRFVHRTMVEGVAFRCRGIDRPETAIQGNFEILFWEDRIYAIGHCTTDPDLAVHAIKVILQSDDRPVLTFGSPNPDEHGSANWAAFSQNDDKHLGVMPSCTEQTAELFSDVEHKLVLLFEPGSCKSEQGFTFAFQLFAIDGEAAEAGERLYREEVDRSRRKVDFDVSTLAGTEVEYEGYDPARGYYLFTMHNHDDIFRYKMYPDGLERYLYRLKSHYDPRQSMRMLWRRTGAPAIGERMEDLSGIWRPFGNHVVHRDSRGAPTGLPLQISKNIHEFTDFPKSYSHCWLHIYSVQEEQHAFEDTHELAIAYNRFYGKLAAQFTQLSLMGWDDRLKRYMGHMDILAQLWHQGINGEAEVFCLSPESMHTDCVYTDWRPMREGTQKVEWGCNVGGGDLLRYARSGWGHRIRLVAPRVEHVSNGPILAQLAYRFISEDELFTATVTHALLAGDDYSRIRVGIGYEALQDAEVRDLSLFSLGSGEYNPTVMSVFATGISDLLLQCETLDLGSDGAGGVLTNYPLSEGRWFSQYGYLKSGGPSSEAGRGVIVRRMLVQAAKHPDLAVQAVPAYQNTTFVDNPEPTASLIFQAMEKDLRICRGDRFELELDIVVYVADRYSPAASTYKPVLYEAFHNRPEIRMVRGSCEKAGLFPVIRSDSGVAEFTMAGGAGFVPVIVQCSGFSGSVCLEELIDGDWHALPLTTESGAVYQADEDPATGEFRIVLGIDCLPDGLNRLIRTFRIG